MWECELMVSVGLKEKGLGRWSKFFPASINNNDNNKKPFYNRLAIQITDINKSIAGELDLSIGFIKPLVRSSLQVKYTTCLTWLNKKLFLSNWK